MSVRAAFSSLPRCHSQLANATVSAYRKKKRDKCTDGDVYNTSGHGKHDNFNVKKLPAGGSPQNELYSTLRLYECVGSHTRRLRASSHFLSCPSFYYLSEGGIENKREIKESIQNLKDVNVCKSMYITYFYTILRPNFIVFIPVR